MADQTGISARIAGGLWDAQATLLTRQAQQLASPTGAVNDPKVEKAAKDFETILLGSWLQQAEKSFAAVPGGDDDDDDEDPGKDQFQSMGMQSLAGALVANGGIGISKMIAGQLQKTEQTPATAPSGAPPAAALAPAAAALPNERPQK